MLTEAIHTPFMGDRFLAVENAKYVMNNMEGFYDEVEFRKDGLVVGRAKEVLGQTLGFLREIKDKSLFDAISQGLFADVKRPKDGGKGLDGLVKKGNNYWNPVEDALKSGLGLASRGREYEPARIDAQRAAGGKRSEEGNGEHS
jgi:beta-lysine 5,6-aminomutase alpha subunit